MATIITKTIGSEGRDYLTISEWNDATKNLDLITLDQKQVGICYNDSQFTESIPIVFNNSNTNSTCYRELTVAEGHRHLGNITRGVSLLYTGNDEVSTQIEILEAYFVLDWIRLTRSELIGNDNDQYNGARIIYCPGSNVSKFIIINHIIIHDWNCRVSGWNTTSMYGIYLYQNGGCRICNSFIVNLHKENDDADGGSMAGILVSQSTNDNNYIINDTILNMTCAANYMKGGGGIGIYGTNIEKCHIWNTISIIRRYIKDQSSIPNSTVEDYSFDFSNSSASDSDYNCERGIINGTDLPGYKQKNFVSGANSLTSNDPFDVFVDPGHDTINGNGFYGYGFHVLGNPPSTDTMYGLHNDLSIYQLEENEIGRIEFTNVYVFKMVAGYKFIDSSSYGSLLELDGNGDTFDDFIPTYTFNGIFYYNYNGMFTLESGDSQLSNIIELENGMIQFKSSYITTDWSTLPLLPTGGSYEMAEAPFNKSGNELIKNHFTGPEVLMVGQQHNNSFRYTIIESTPKNINGNLKLDSPCVGKAKVLDVNLFPELEFDITGKSRI